MAPMDRKTWNKIFGLRNDLIGAAILVVIGSILGFDIAVLSGVGAYWFEWLLIVAIFVFGGLLIASPKTGRGHQCLMLSAFVLGISIGALIVAWELVSINK